MANNVTALPATGTADGTEKGGFLNTQKVVGLLFLFFHQALISFFI